MTVLGEFERRLERAVEGFFARVFRSGVHPVEIGKRVLRVMEDGKVVGLRRTYVPNVYRITLSQNDYGRLAPIEAKLVEELEVFVSEAAKQRSWELAGSPRVSFASGPRLSPGEFRIDSEAVVVPSRARAPAPAPAVVRLEPRPSEQRTQVIEGAEATLAVIEDDQVVRSLPISGRLGLGRQADNDLVIPDPGVSRHHAEVLEEDGEFVLRDLGSTNGTTVNGSPVQRHRLRDGDRIVVGHSVIEFRRG